MIKTVKAMKAMQIKHIRFQTLTKLYSPPELLDPDNQILFWNCSTIQNTNFELRISGKNNPQQLDYLLFLHRI